MNTTTITMPHGEALAKLREYRRRIHNGAHKDAVEKWKLCETLYKQLADGEELDIGGHIVQWLDTPHVPHAWEAGLLYDTTTKTLFCGDLFTRYGDFEASTSDDIVGPAVQAEDVHVVQAAGWDDEAIYYAITTCALFNFYNRWISATGVPEMSEEGHRQQGRALASRGYTRD